MRERLSGFLPLILLLPTGLGLAIWSWGTWMHPLIDFGRELYVPWRITAGEVLYRDLAYFNGPLSPYLNAAWFWVCDTSLRSLVLANLALIAVVTVLLYRLLLGISDRLTATAGSLIYLTLFCFGQLDWIANYNWVCPYSHEMTHGLALALAAVFLWTRFHRNGGLVPLIGAGLCTGLCALTKPEILAALGLAMALGLWLSPHRPRRRPAGFFCAAAALPGTVAFLLLCTAMPAGEALRGTLGGWVHVFNRELTSLPFYEWSMGTSDLAGHAEGILLWLGVYALVLLPPAGLALLLRREGWHRSVLAVLVGAGMLLYLGQEEVEWRYAYGPLPLLLLLIGGPSLVASVRKKEARSHATLVLCALALALLVKILFYARVHHYGFALAMPAVMLCVAALLSWVPRRIERLGGHGWTFRAAGIAVLGVMTWGHGREHAGWIRKKAATVGSGADAFRCAETAEAIRLLLGSLERLPPETTLVVLPEGVTLNYLTRLENPTPYINFLPPELIMFGEDRMLASLEKSRPDYVVLAGRLTKEYGLPLFGRDYGQKLMAWVRANYVPRHKIGPEPLVPARLEDYYFSLWLLGRQIR